MNKSKPLDQDLSVGSKIANDIAKVVKKSGTKGTIFESLIVFAFSVPDFRRTTKGNIRHHLGDILILMILGEMSGCTSRADLIAFGRHNLSKFQSMGLLQNGVPSEPTLHRVEKGIDATELSDQMAQFTQTFHQLLIQTATFMEIICMDGKALRGTIQPNGRNPDIVSAYSPSTGLILATEACQEKSNEIKAVPILLEKIDIKGKLITADAMSLQKDIIDLICKNEGNYIIELKANQRKLLYDVEDEIKKTAPVSSYTVGPELSHGRIETRTYNVFNGMELIVNKEKWTGNLTFVEVISETTIKSTGEHTCEKRLYMSNLPMTTKRIGSPTRTHWSIESMHWGLDRNFRQDHTKRKHTDSARNMDTIKRMAFSIFSIWRGLRKKRSDKALGIAALKRRVSTNFTALKKFLSQKLQKINF